MSLRFIQKVAIYRFSCMKIYTWNYIWTIQPSGNRVKYVQNNKAFIALVSSRSALALWRLIKKRQFPASLLELSHVAAVASVSRYYYSDQGRTVLQRLYGPWTAAALFLRPCTESSIFATLVEFKAWIRQKPNYSVTFFGFFHLHLHLASLAMVSWYYYSDQGRTVLQRLYGPWTAVPKVLYLLLLWSFELELDRILITQWYLSSFCM